MSPDIDAAKAALDGQTPRLTYCYANSTLGNGDAVVVQSSLEAAGFQIDLNPIEGSSYVSTVRDPNSGCDMFFFSWAPAYPDASSVMNPLLNGASGINLSLLDEPTINDELTSLGNASDRAGAAPGYGELDATIMQDYAPMIPTVSANVYQLAGTNVKGASSTRSDPSPASSIFTSSSDTRTGEPHSPVPPSGKAISRELSDPAHAPRGRDALHRLGRHFLAVFRRSRRPGRALCGIRGCSDEQLAQIRASYGLDLPLTAQYLAFLGGSSFGRQIGTGGALIQCAAPCFGVSLRTGEAVTDIIARGIPITVSIVIGGFLLYMLVGVGLACSPR